MKGPVIPAWKIAAGITDQALSAKVEWKDFQGEGGIKGAFCEEGAKCLGTEGGSLFGCQALEIGPRGKDKAFKYQFCED